MHSILRAVTGNLDVAGGEMLGVLRILYSGI